ncbi:MAG: DUF1844 domain-containing protein [Acidobacteria bacterium]|nr:DUF1844 domain-containing protein [Acidobacteriota bacterium]
MEQPGPAITFIDFILSLARTTAVHFGDIEEPETGQRLPPNLPAAAQMVEIIAMLQERTRGNLTEPEERLMDDLLYELRMRYVQAQQDDRRIVEP